VARLRGSGSRTRFASSQRRKSSWGIGVQTGADGAPQAIAASMAQIATGGVTALNDGLTIVRTRGELLIWVEAVSVAAGNGFHGAFGIAIATQQAFIAGAASLPQPIDEEDWDGWLFHKYFGVFAGGLVAAGTAADQANQVNNVSAAVRIEIDSKAMRKMNTDQTVYGTIQVVELGTAAMKWAVNSRMLSKLP